jgi:hypothetical protein
MRECCRGSAMIAKTVAGGASMMVEPEIFLSVMRSG